MRRAAVAGALSAVLVLGVPRPASAALLWTLVASPTAVSTGVETTYSLIATNGDVLTEIGCVVVHVPARFAIAAVGVTGSSAGDSWIAWRSGNRVTVQTTSGGDRLALLDTVTFTVRATALSGGSLAWAADAYRQQDCSGEGSLLGVPPVVIVTGPAVTPTPAPTAPPTPAPTPQPTLTPAPTAAPTVAPTAPATPGPSPGATTTPAASQASSAPPASFATAAPAGARSSASPRPTPTPVAAQATRTPNAEPANTSLSGPSSRGDSGAPRIRDDTAPAPPGGAPGGPVGAGSLSVMGTDAAGIQLATASIGLLAGLDTWVVPAATIAVPGLLVLVWVAVQALGTVAWIPAARRLRGGRPPAGRVRA